MRILSILCMVCVSFSGCTDEGKEPPGQLSAQTDKTTYTSGELIHVSVTNTADFSAYVPSCCNTLAFYIERSDNGTWRDFLGYGIPCLRMCPGIQTILTPGNSKAEDFSLTDHGTYRLRIPFGRSVETQMAQEIVTNTFVIE